jgi:hypothetical protein
LLVELPDCPNYTPKEKKMIKPEAKTPYYERLKKILEESYICQTGEFKTSKAIKEITEMFETLGSLKPVDCTMYHDKFSHPVGSPCKICQPDKLTEGFCKLMEEMGVEFIDTKWGTKSNKSTHDKTN